MQKIINDFENWLEIDKTGRISDSLRARAIYFIGAILAFAQIINLVNMTHTYGRWTADHNIAVLAIFLFLGAIPLLKKYKKFYLFAAYYSVLLLSGIIGASMLDITGINSALLPYLVLGSIINGFISGWRAVLGFGVVSLGLVWVLYLHSTAVPTGALFDPVLFEARNFQRAMQISIIMCLTTAITGFASYAMHKAFFELEEKAKEEREASNAKTEFLANLSHELRTPLNGVMGMSGLLQNTSLTKTQAEYVNIIHSCSKHLSAILGDVLDLTKLDAAAIAPEDNVFDLRNELETILQLYRPAAKSKGLAIGMRYNDDLPRKFIGDATKIRKIINNLFSNAIKFTDKGSAYICVDGKKTDDNHYKMIIGVQDTGVGIKSEDLDKIFTRFSQLDTRLARKAEGTGLGLAITKKLAKLLGGRLTVITRPGEGSTFALKITLKLTENNKTSNNIINTGFDFFHNGNSANTKKTICEKNQKPSLQETELAGQDAENIDTEVEMENVPLYCDDTDQECKTAIGLY